MQTRLAVLAVAVRIVTSQDADLGAYADPLHRIRGDLPHADASLTPPILAWDDDAPLPTTISSTSHYQTGSSEEPGAFAVNRREPWLLPAKHDPHVPHRSDGPITHPSAAVHQTSQPSSGEAWHVPSPNANVQVTGLPPQPDWPMPADHLHSLSMTSDELATRNDFTAAMSDVPSKSQLTEAQEWGTAPRAGNEPSAAEHDDDIHEANGNSTEQLAVPTAEPQQLSASSASAAAAAGLPIIAGGFRGAEAAATTSAPELYERSNGSPRGTNWWEGEKPVRSWRFAGLAARISRASAARSGARSGPGDSAARSNRNDEEAEWQQAGPTEAASVAAPHDRTAPTHAAAAALASGQAPVVAVVNGSSSAGGLAEGAIGTVYEVTYS